MTCKLWTQRLRLGALGLAAGALAAWVVTRPAGPRAPRRVYATADSHLPPPEHPIWAAWERRHQPLAGAVNLRDSGGYQTADGRRLRWGRLFRSGHLAGLTPEARAGLDGLGLRLICDLRTPNEAARQPDYVPAGARYRHRPTYPDGNAGRWFRALFLRRHELDVVFTEGYLRMIRDSAPAFGAVLRELADPASLPGLVHCTAGKDRTGLVFALLLLWLGVPEETVVADYALSNLAYPRILRAAAHDLERAAVLGIDVDEMRPIMSADPRYLRAALAALQAEYGSVDAYLRQAAGLTAADRERLAANLLEPADPVQ